MARQLLINPIQLQQWFQSALLEPIGLLIDPGPLGLTQPQMVQALNRARAAAADRQLLSIQVKPLADGQLVALVHKSILKQGVPSHAP